MANIWDFFSQDAGQRRRRALDEFMSGVEQFIPPNLRPAAGAVAQMNPIQGMQDAMQAGGVVFDPEQTAEARKRAALDMGIEMAMALTPAALAARGYLTPVQGVMESLLGGSPAQQQIAQDAANLVSDVKYAGRSAAEGDIQGIFDVFRSGREAQPLSASIPVYQGRSSKNLDEFFNPKGVSWGTTDLGTAEQFAGKSELSELYPNYAGQVYNLEFDLKNPMDVDIRETLWSADKEMAKVAEAKAAGYDGLRIKHPSGKIDYVAFDPSQVKQVASSDKPAGLLAYHGSPHSFDKFDISKIGTGEGAQAYGHGLYFAENEKVARDYRDALTEGLRLQGKPLDTVWTDEIRERWPDLYKGLSEKDADTMDALIGTMEGVGSIKDAENAAASVSKGAERLLEARVKPLLGEAPKGSMYEVKLLLEKNDLLDYDRPVSQQPKILAKIDDKYGDPEIIASQLGLDFETATGGAWIQQLEGLGIDTESKKAASDWFKAADVQGIKYFDQGSRNTAEGKSLGVMETPDGFVGRVEGSVPSVFGPSSPQRVMTRSKPYKTKEEAEKWINEAINRQTRNYVVFDDRLIEIVRKYGIAGAAALLGVSSADIEGALAQGMSEPPQKGLLD